MRSGKVWDFPYDLPSDGGPIEIAAGVDVVVASRGEVGAPILREKLRDLGPDLEVETLLARAPLFWTRVRSPTAQASREAIADILSNAGILVRYVASARAETMWLPPPLDLSGLHPARAVDWATRPARPVPAPSASGGHWFLGNAGGLRVNRSVCGTGVGTRLAVIDDDAADFEHLELDRVERVGVKRIPEANGHAALMVGWASGAFRPDGTRFAGVAPDASVRAYCMPKPGIDVVSLPLAIARAVFDGADVIVCATYVEGTTSPMLDDALDVAAHLGREGLGTIVCVPTGREASSPPGSGHASFSLSLGDPASDPRVHCVAPGGRQGGWFTWRSSRGKLRPFANRGPAVRWLAPGDDMAHPFSPQERLFHAESSGASAVTAGVMLLVLACNPSLRSREVHALLARTADAPESDPASDASLADPADVLPLGRDRDGHDAKCGYGRLNATRACASARDPLALALVAMGEDEGAVRWCVHDRRPYSAELARWAVRILLTRPDTEHAVRVIARHARLVVAEPRRGYAQPPGALARELMLLGRELVRSAAPPPSLQREVERALETLRRASSLTEPFGHAVDFATLALLECVWALGPQNAESSAFRDSTLQA